MDTTTIMDGFVEPMAFEPLVTQLKSGDKPQHDEFAVISDLSLLAATSLTQQLAGVNPEMLREFVLNLITIASDDVSMDFTGVFIAFIHNEDAIIRSLILRKDEAISKASPLANSNEKASAAKSRATTEDEKK